ncbi:MAG: ABC transporter ATP-binding protein [Kiritimatiellales bacterium]|nr:ABC transporter ATP-binding protein [Kiritimatiellales bacterium]
MRTPTLEIKNLGFCYPDGTEALYGISCRIEYGEAIGLIGGNGAGKSTLLQHLNGCLMPSEGMVLFGGTPITRETLAEVRRAVGVVFQDPDDQLFMSTVFDDVAFGPLNQGLPSAEVAARVYGALERVGMRHLSERPPYKLSGGEKRAVAIATILAVSPDIIVLDEPSSNLDPRGRRRLINLLRGFEQTRIIATHDLELVVEVCQRVIVLDNGRIVAEGPVREILDNEELMLAHGLERPHILRHQHPH